MAIPNHVLAGALIGLVVKEPALALLLALGSHFVMDALPHFGYKGNKGFGEVLKHRLSYWVGIVSLPATMLVVALLLFNHLWLALFAGIVAAIPDVLGVYNYRRYERHGQKAHGILKVVHVQFHRAIQWCERPWGVYVEVAAFVILFALLTAVIM
jgi:hypothetical protein